jgi:hypothetical protein
MEKNGKLIDDNFLMPDNQDFISIINKIICKYPSPITPN